MNENEALKSNETGKIDIISFLDDVLNRLKRVWWVILVLTLGFGALFYFRSTTRYTPMDIVIPLLMFLVCLAAWLLGRWAGKLLKLLLMLPIWVPKRYW